jgi:hypothetical protein
MSFKVEFPLRKVVMNNYFFLKSCDEVDGTWFLIFMPQDEVLTRYSVAQSDVTPWSCGTNIG